MIRDKEVFDYHAGHGRKGKIEVLPTKPLLTQRDLSLAYSPGVAKPCLAIADQPELAFEYTARGNLVAVVSNGTAVLGLGNIGALASKPVMEGKGCLFKKFADIDVFDIEVDTKDPDELIEVVTKLEPTFGGINLEDIKAPECFYIEETLKQRMSIPVFHDDQHGTAIITAAALINGAELVEKDIGAMRMVVSGAGAAAIAGAKLFMELGIKRENIILCDSRGVVHKGRERLNPYKEQFATDLACRTLGEALVGADVFLGYSVGGLVTTEMVKSMADKPLVFAMANPDPEISYPDAKAARPDAIVATGRSDFPNQVNNVLGFPAIFRGALDVNAKEINMQMMIAAAKALADLAKEDVPDSVQAAYGGKKLRFGPDYVIPTPFDPRVLTWEAPAVAKAALATGVARKEIDIDQYRQQLEDRIYGRVHVEMRKYQNEARKNPQRVVFPEADRPTLLRAVDVVLEEGIAQPVLIGQREQIARQVADLGFDYLDRVEIVNPLDFERFEEYCEEYMRVSGRRGVTPREAHYRLATRRHNFAMMMLRMGDVDASVLGLATHFPEAMKPVLELIELKRGVSRLGSMHMLVFKNDVKFFADCAVNVEPDAELLADIAIQAAEEVASMGIVPRVAMISFSNFGASDHPAATKVARATEIVHKRRPYLEVEGEMQVNVAIDHALQRQHYPVSQLSGPANVLVFPNIDAGNACIKMGPLGSAEVVGPILLGLEKPVAVVERSDSVESVVRLTSIAAVQAQRRKQETSLRSVG
jgi:malate dehydrogenase (oxaloacetate-decarboxylating)(NADP+)